MSGVLGARNLARNNPRDLRLRKLFEILSHDPRVVTPCEIGVALSESGAAKPIFAASDG